MKFKYIKPLSYISFLISCGVFSGLAIEISQNTWQFCSLQICFMIAVFSAIAYCLNDEQHDK